MSLSSAKRFNYMMLILLAIFILPIILAHFIHKYHSALKLGTTNYGQFVNRLTPINDFSLDYKHQPTAHNPSITQHPWTLLYLNNDTCHQGCLQQLKKMNTVHQATGKYFYLVKELLILPQSTPKDILDKLAKQYPYLDIATAAKKTRQRIASNSNKGRLDSFYILDPTQKFVLHYSTHAQGNGILRDLQHLLRISNG